MTATDDREIAPVLNPAARPAEPWDELDALLAEVDETLSYDPNSPGQGSPGPVWLDACRLAGWLHQRFTDEQLGQLNGKAGTVRRWRAGEVARAHLTVADEILRDLGGHLHEIPASIWITWSDPIA